MKDTAKTPKSRTMRDPSNAYPDNVNYPSSEDIYNKGKKELEIDPEDISKLKPFVANEGKQNVKDFEEDMSGDDLDIPGAELDEQQEDIGSEDEENNGYSIGGDNHHNLEEEHE